MPTTSSGSGSRSVVNGMFDRSVHHDKTKYKSISISSSSRPFPSPLSPHSPPHLEFILRGKSILGDVSARLDCQSQAIPFQFPLSQSFLVHKIRDTYVRNPTKRVRFQFSTLVPSQSQHGYWPVLGNTRGCAHTKNTPGCGCTDCCHLSYPRRSSRDKSKSGDL